MATYKVIQDIEAEDKFVGPLTLKQFVFAMFGALFGYLSFIVTAKGLAWGLLVTSPPALFGFFMAVPWSKEQPTDIWVLAKVRFRLKPKKRIWDQAGLQELVTITAPKKIEKPKTNGLSETEVQSRLKALAETIDSRGWVIKNVPPYGSTENADGDRLVNPELLPTRAETANASTPDIMEAEKKLDNLIMEHDQARLALTYDRMDRARQGDAVEAGFEPEATTVLPPEDLYSEQAVSDSLKASKASGTAVTGNMHAISMKPGADSPPGEGEITIRETSRGKQKTEVDKAKTPVTETVSPDILELARQNGLRVSTIARRANDKGTEQGPNEVVVSLH